MRDHQISDHEYTKFSEFFYRKTGIKFDNSNVILLTNALPSVLKKLTQKILEIILLLCVFRQMVKSSKS